MKHVSFTGTRHGMTEVQRARFRDVLAGVCPDWFHHGDCVGADAEAHEDVARTLCLIHIYPSTAATRAWCAGAALTETPKPPLDRNRDIVDAGEALIATPKRMAEELRSGTWAAIRYARKRRKPIHIIWPDGTYTPPAPNVDRGDIYKQILATIAHLK
jgi:hypothetical protein